MQFRGQKQPLQQSSSSSDCGDRPDEGKKIRVELAVNINHQSDLEKIDEALKHKVRHYFRVYYIDYTTSTCVISSPHP